VLGLTPCRLLALAVLETAVRDAHRGSLDARYFLEQDGPPLAFWCGLLGIRPATVRLAAADPQWPERCAKAKAVLRADCLMRNRPGSTRPLAPGA
jgi:hypothetical protein